MSKYQVVYMETNEDGYITCSKISYLHNTIVEAEGDFCDWFDMKRTSELRIYDEQFDDKDR
jgi:hypothetical protein